MLLGKCPKCGEQFCGWLLAKSDYQYCPKCGGPLTIIDGQSDTRVNKEDLSEIDKKYEMEWHQ